MDKNWAKSKLTFKDEQWAFYNSEKAIDEAFTTYKKMTSPEIRKFMVENENAVKQMMADSFMTGYLHGRTN